jgi:hypothetical protein
MYAHLANGVHAREYNKVRNHRAGVFTSLPPKLMLGICEMRRGVWWWAVMGMYRDTQMWRVAVEEGKR